MFVCQEANFNQSQNSSEISTGSLFFDFLKKQFVYCLFVYYEGNTPVQKWLSITICKSSSEDVLPSVVEGWNFHCTGFLADCHTKVQMCAS